MIDLHTHFLPKIDDGAKNVEESAAMLRSAALQGVRICVATPHAVIHKNSDIRRFLARRASAHASVESRIARAPFDFPKIIMGAEVYLDNNINQYDGIEGLCIENTRAMLIEFPVENGFDSRSEECLYELSRGGITPVIAHIDRYPFAEDLLRALNDINAVYQINASVLATFGGRRLLKRLMKYNAAYVFSSDMHNMTQRPCNMLAAYKRVLKKYGGRAEEMFFENAGAVLNVL